MIGHQTINVGELREDFGQVSNVDIARFYSCSFVPPFTKKTEHIRENMHLQIFRFFLQVFLVSFSNGLQLSLPVSDSSFQIYRQYGKSFNLFRKKYKTVVWWTPITAPTSRDGRHEPDLTIPFIWFFFSTSILRPPFLLVKVASTPALTSVSKIDCTPWWSLRNTWWKRLVELPSVEGGGPCAIPIPPWECFWLVELMFDNSCSFTTLIL